MAITAQDKNLLTEYMNLARDLTNVVNRAKYLAAFRTTNGNFASLTTPDMSVIPDLSHLTPTIISGFETAVGAIVSNDPTLGFTTNSSKMLQVPAK